MTDLSNSQSASDAAHMAQALRLAEKARYLSHPNPAVGCVLVKNDQVIAEGHTLVAGQGHAEANALNSAGAAAAGATAYVTLEPCSFHGRTPSCAHALVEAGICRVVVATLDPDIRNAGAGMRVLEEAGIAVSVGLLEDSAKKLIQGHIKRHTEKRPFVRLKLAMTLDGKTALANGESRWITSKPARADVQKYRAMSAAIVTGVQTVIDDDPQLNVRADELDVELADIAAGVDRPVYILDTKGRLPEEAGLRARASTVVVSGEGSDADLTLPLEGDRLDLNALLHELAVREHSEVLFECGATLAGVMISQKLVDELVLYVAPKFMGSSARSLLNFPEVDRMCDLAELVVSDVRQIGPDIRITASPLEKRT